jgi:hypothetical protein
VTTIVRSRTVESHPFDYAQGGLKRKERAWMGRPANSPAASLRPSVHGGLLPVCPSSDQSWQA